MKELLKENTYILIFISVIIQCYFKWKQLTAFYSQGLNSGGEWGTRKENIITLLQAQHMKYPSCDWSGKVNCYTVNCADVQNIINFNFIKILQNPKQNKRILYFTFVSRQFQSNFYSSCLCSNETKPLWNSGIYFAGTICASFTSCIS